MPSHSALQDFSHLNQNIVNTATQHLKDILNIVFQHTPEQTAVVVYDTHCPLAETLAAAYHRCLPTGLFIPFDSVAPADILETFQKLSPFDLVVLIQSTSFRLEAFRIRIELFKRSLKVIEHPHLARMLDHEINYYIDSLAYDPVYFRGVGRTLKRMLDEAKSACIDSGGEALIFDSPLEPAKLNVGDYSEMTNIGGQFPIGEVFTEAQNLESVNGRIRLFAFADTSFSVNKPERPITLVITKGRVTDVINSTAEFDKVLANIRADEGQVWVRELGFGMNKAFSEERTVSDIGTYERMCGIHLSLGAKHAIYKKPQFKRANVRHHVDVFAVTEKVILDDCIVFQNNTWQVPI